MNEKLKAPQDAMAKLEQGKIVISKSVDGKQYDVTSLLKDYDKQKHKSEIHLKSAYIQPIKENDPIIKKKKALQNLLTQSVDYKVQNEVYSLKAKDLIQNASMSKDMKVTIDASEIKNKVAEINKAKSTLHKDFAFKTHSGSVISVKVKDTDGHLMLKKRQNKFNKPLRKAKNHFLLLIFTEMVGRRKGSAMKQQRIMASETHMQKFPLQINKFGFIKMGN